MSPRTSTCLPPTTDVVDGYRRYVSAGRARLSSMTGAAVEVASEGSRVWDATGRQYLDCGGYGVFLLGHRHPAVVSAVIDQINLHPMGTRLMLEPTVVAAAKSLIDIAPGKLRYAHFVNSGAEATEAAIKLARAHGKSTLIATTRGFHGKTMGALSLTGRDLYQAPFRPLLPGVVHVPYGDADALSRQLASTPKAAVIVEPVQGEGGVNIPPPGYLTAVADACRRHDALLILDEIQTGLGRLGRWWGADIEGVGPDLLLVGKNLSGGVIPAAAILATEAAYAPFNDDPFLHTSTFAASPVAMAAAHAAITTIAAESLIERAASLGQHILAAVRDALLPTCGHLVRDVRGAGLLIGIELADPALAAELVLELTDAGVLLNHSLNSTRVIRLTPPAILDQEDLAWLTDAFTRTAKTMAIRYPRAPQRSA